mmetsp:Transcript_33314/g.48739  ORF Transcript_33314/g.48739 Transcript_33314/m.48739 type:complete len:204 (-) Transcript_33314:35-646(-)
MSKALTVAATLAMASAFQVPTPVSKTVQASSSALKMGYETENGVTAPLGFFDPLGFTKNCDESTFNWYRNAEIKHGRIAMMSFVGYLIPHFAKFGGMLSTSENIAFADVPVGHAAVSSIPASGKLQIFIAIGIMELLVWPVNSSDPGNFQPVGGWVRYEDAAVKKSKLTKELNNGRAAMLAILGLIAQELQTGKSPIAELLGQ